MSEPTIECVECHRTFYRSKFLGVREGHAHGFGLCQWCANPDLDPLDDAPEPESEESELEPENYFDGDGDYYGGRNDR